MRPLIGITPLHDPRRGRLCILPHYPAALEEAGALPVLLPPAKDRAELALLERFLRLDKPVLALCRGMQLLNVHLGGTLYQDLDTQFPTRVTHRQQPPYDLPVHAVSVRPGGPLYRIVGREQLAVNSYHHQAVRDTAPPLSVQARAPDGIVEAVALPWARFVLGVQWHPEAMPREDESAAAIFSAFLSACGG